MTKNYKMTFSQAVSDTITETSFLDQVEAQIRNEIDELLEMGLPNVASLIWHGVDLEDGTSLIVSPDSNGGLFVDIGVEVTIQPNIVAPVSLEKIRSLDSE